jgi:multicomponent K+:H+ antiporter subunit E
MMRRVLPHPLLSVALVIVWLLLVNEASLGHLLLGTALGILIPMFTNAFWPEQPRLGRPLLILRLASRLLFDIVIANFTVALQILSPPRALRPDFIEYPVELDNDFAITVLASLISLTPGTVSSDLSEDRRTLLIHALDVGDKAMLIDDIKRKYERPLLEIFRC